MTQSFLFKSVDPRNDQRLPVGMVCGLQRHQVAFALVSIALDQSR